MNKDKFNLSDEEFERELRKQVNVCPRCKSGTLYIGMLIGGMSSNTIAASCLGCGHTARNVLSIEALGTENRLATIVTHNSLIKSCRSVIKKFKRSV